MGLDPPKMTKKLRCNHCHGWGTNIDEFTPCHICGGYGTGCKTCKGKGKLRTSCRHCYGTGWYKLKEAKAMKHGRGRRR